MFGVAQPNLMCAIVKEGEAKRREDENKQTNKANKTSDGQAFAGECENFYGLLLVLMNEFFPAG